eukprot:6181993-Pleurochrysis_carterae.AAC.3
MQLALSWGGRKTADVHACGRGLHACAVHEAPPPPWRKRGAFQDRNGDKVNTMVNAVKRYARLGVGDMVKKPERVVQ